MNEIRTVLITGGAGYVGSALVPALVEKGYRVKVYDLFIYGDCFVKNENLELIKADIRNQAMLKSSLEGCDAVIHLACISNDPSFELNPALGKAINLDAFEPMVRISRDVGVQRFIYASSSSVYGIRDEAKVTENLSLKPLTDYSRYKAECEDILSKFSSSEFTTLTVRPATVCGYAVRLRLDLIVNILTNHAFTNRKIKVLGGDQYRPNIHIKDMVRFYLNSLEWSSMDINNEIYNVGHINYTVKETAEIVSSVVGSDVVKEVVETDDNRSYRVCSDKIKQELGFEPAFSVEDAVQDLKEAFSARKILNSMNNSNYYNIKRMQEIALV